MATLTKIYSDLDLTFNRQPVSGDVSMVFDSRAVINSVKYLLMTNFYERPWQPTLGSNVTTLLFEPVEVETESILKQEIINVINNFEPRVTIQNITVSANQQQDGYDVSLSFYVGNSTQPTQISVFLERNR